MSEETKVATAEDTRTQTEENETSVAEASETVEESATSEEGQEKPEEASEEKEEEGQPKRKGGFQRRIDKLTAQSRAKDEEIEYWRRKALDREEQPRSEAAPAPESKPKPKVEDFELDDGSGTYNYAEYAEALAKWTADEAIKQYAAQQEAQAKAQEYFDKEVAFAAEVDDYEEVTQVAKGTLQQTRGPGVRALAGALLDSERGPELLYYLGQNPDEAKRIAQLLPTRAVMALGQLEAQLAEQEEENQGKTEATPPLVTRAPKPPVPVKKPSGGKVAHASDPETHHQLSDDEWAKKRAEEMRNFRKGK